MITGALKKMTTALQTPVAYYLSLNQELILLNSYLNQEIHLRYLGEIYCIQCGRKTPKSFQQGHCFPCYRRLLECNLCVIHPEKCLGLLTHCNQPHVVYLANSSGLKVGITREAHVPSRWIDQGATQGLVIFKTQNRYQAGVIEQVLKQYVADKTKWQVMLKSHNQDLLLSEKRDEIWAQAKPILDNTVQQFPLDIESVTHAEMISIHYPILEFPQKITTFNLDKNPLVEGLLKGIKGQYLILDTGVISIRKFAGYAVEWRAE